MPPITYLTYLITYFITYLSFISCPLYVSGYSKFCFNFLLPLINSLNMCTYNLKIYRFFNVKGFPGGTSGKEPACQCRRLKREAAGLILGWENTLKKEMATHSSILHAWRIPRTATVHRVAKS